MVKEDNNKLLILGKGSREHALAESLARSPYVESIYVVPGNAGTHESKNVKFKNVPNVYIDDNWVSFEKLFD